MFDLTTYVKKWRIRQLKTVFSTLDTLCALGPFSRVCERGLLPHHRQQHLQDVQHPHHHHQEHGAFRPQTVRHLKLYLSNNKP